MVLSILMVWSTFWRSRKTLTNLPNEIYLVAWRCNRGIKIELLYFEFLAYIKVWKHGCIIFEISRSALSGTIKCFECSPPPPPSLPPKLPWDFPSVNIPAKLTCNFRARSLGFRAAILFLPIPQSVSFIMIYMSSPPPPPSPLRSVNLAALARNKNIRARSRRPPEKSCFRMTVLHWGMKWAWGGGSPSSFGRLGSLHCDLID